MRTVNTAKKIISLFIFQATFFSSAQALESCDGKDVDVGSFKTYRCVDVAQQFKIEGRFYFLSSDTDKDGNRLRIQCKVGLNIEPVILGSNQYYCIKQ